MTTIIVVFPRLDDARAIKNILVRKGYSVAAPCTTGAQAVNIAYALSEGIIICGYKLSDMVYSELLEYKPKSFELLLVASRNLWSDHVIAGVACIEMPLKVNELMYTLEAMQQARIVRRNKRRLKPAERSNNEQELIDHAKHILMVKNNMSEIEAHRYLQKCSMDSGNSLVEAAQMVMSMNE